MPPLGFRGHETPYSSLPSIAEVSNSFSAILHISSENPVGGIQSADTPGRNKHAGWAKFSCTTQKPFRAEANPGRQTLVIDRAINFDHFGESRHLTLYLRGFPMLNTENKHIEVPAHTATNWDSVV